MEAVWVIGTVGSIIVLIELFPMNDVLSSLFGASPSPPPSRWTRQTPSVDSNSALSRISPKGSYFSGASFKNVTDPSLIW